MARHLRIQVRDGWYHVMSRGNGGEVIYRTDEDRRRFLGPVAEFPDRFGTEIHAFVLMDNRHDWGRNDGGDDAASRLAIGGCGAGGARVELCGGGAGDSPFLAPGGGRHGIGGVHPSSQGKMSNNQCMTSLPLRRWRWRKASVARYVRFG